MGGGVEEEADLRGERWPVVLESQEIIGPLGPDGPGDVALAADGVDGDECAGEFEPLQRERDGRERSTASWPRTSRWRVAQAETR